MCSIQFCSKSMQYCSPNLNLFNILTIRKKNLIIIASSTTILLGCHLHLTSLIIVVRRITSSQVVYYDVLLILTAVYKKLMMLTLQANQATKVQQDIIKVLVEPFPKKLHFIY